MEENVTVRNETPADHQEVEALVRRAFWNLYVPGCSEHYLAHILRGHPDFVPELDLVLEAAGRVVGSILYTRARLVGKAGREKEILTFGPVCVAPEFQRRGYGKRLIAASLERAARLGWEGVVIVGDPANYVSSGFCSSKKFGISLEDGTFPTAMLAKELKPGALSGEGWVYRQSPAYDFDPEEARRFDDGLEPWEKGFRPSQEAFDILSHSVLL